MSENTAPETITWSDMTDAGIDIDRVERIENTADATIPTWQATAPDGETAIVFGICLDIDRVIPEGQHTGWDACWYEVNTDGDERGRWDGSFGQKYYEPDELADLLADVAKLVPIAPTA